jgi:hypothetical protein
VLVDDNDPLDLIDQSVNFLVPDHLTNQAVHGSFWDAEHGGQALDGDGRIMGRVGEDVRTERLLLNFPTSFVRKKM